MDDLALKWFKDMQAGQFDRNAEYAPAYSAQLTDEAVQQIFLLNHYGRCLRAQKSCKAARRETRPSTW